MNNKHRWHSVKQHDLEEVETFLREHEPFCTAPASKFKKGLQKQDKVWKLCDGSGIIKALLLYSNKAVYPIFNAVDVVPMLPFLRFPLLQNPVYAIQGCAHDVLQIEKMLSLRGYLPSDQKDFFLMALDTLPFIPEKNNANLIIRTPDVNDLQNLYELQKQYEIEEVIPKNGTFNPAGCRMTVESMCKRHHVLVGEVDGHLAAKAHINADSYSRCQIGGVFVEPSFRGRGYATELVASFCCKLIANGRGVSLFVNKTNIPALKVYKKLGFNIVSDYRITYY